MSSENRFTGGDSFVGFEAKAHQLMMRNELKGGVGAYHLSHAATPNSGFSFGGNQMDLAHSRRARNVLTDILRHHVDDRGNPVFSREKEAELVERLKTKGNPHVLTSEEKREINQALSSPYGREALHEAYKAELCDPQHGRIAKADRILEAARMQSLDPKEQLFLESDAARLRTFDICNQFGSHNQARLKEFLEGKTIQAQDGTELTARHPITMEDFDRFLMHTNYARHHIKDLERRREGMEQVLGEAIPTAPEWDRVSHKTPQKESVTFEKSTSLEHNPKEREALDRSYVIQKGDTLAGIAKQHHLSWKEVMAANPHIKHPDHVYAGQTLCLPEAHPHALKRTTDSPTQMQRLEYENPKLSIS